MNYKKLVFNTFNLKFHQYIIYLSLIPTGLIGIGLNILTFVILRGEQFRLPVIHYLRDHTINSCFLCLLITTVITCHINNEWSAKYYAHFYIPFINFLVFYQTSLDIVLTFDRALTFTTRFEKFKKLKPTLVSITLLVISIVTCFPSWITFGTKQIEIQLNERKRFFLFNNH
jgi:hypothetical protein